MDWLTENWANLVEIAFAILAVASLITALTPTPRDDEFVRKVLDWMSILKPRTARGTLKAPFTRTKDHTG